MATTMGEHQWACLSSVLGPIWIQSTLSSGYPRFNMTEIRSSHPKFVVWPPWRLLYGQYRVNIL
jgi:hypothetical protein